LSLLVLFLTRFGNSCAMVEILPPNNPLFFVANVFLLISFLLSNVLYLRIVLAIGTLILALWAAIILNFALDVFLINLLFFFINMVQATIIIYNKRNIKFSPEFEQVYVHVFGPSRYNLQRSEFLKLVKIGSIRHIKKDSFYAQIGDCCTNLSVMVSGHLTVSIPIASGEMVINKHLTNEFIDSPEFIVNNTSGIFTVNIKAIEDSTYITWQKETLLSLLTEFHNLRFAVNAVLCHDLASLIFRENITVSSNNARLNNTSFAANFIKLNSK